MMKKEGGATNDNIHKVGINLTFQKNKEKMPRITNTFTSKRNPMKSNFENPEDENRVNLKKYRRAAARMPTPIRGIIGFLSFYSGGNM